MPERFFLQTANLLSANCWENVVDFRWHKSTPSPNWRPVLQVESLAEMDRRLIDDGWSIASEPTWIVREEGREVVDPMEAVEASKSGCGGHAGVHTDVDGRVAEVNKDINEQHAQNDCDEDEI